MFNIFGFANDHQLLKGFLLHAKAWHGDVKHCLKMISSWMYEYFLCCIARENTIIVITPQSIPRKSFLAYEQ